jgi:hypothetical protein
MMCGSIFHRTVRPILPFPISSLAILKYQPDFHEMKDFEITAGMLKDYVQSY